MAFLSPPEFFVAETPEADLMSYQELAGYIVDLSERGFDVVGLVVDLHRKVSFPFVTFILTLIAVPFAVTTGPRGALYGVGVGIGIAFSYWIILSIFGAFGSGVAYVLVRKLSHREDPAVIIFYFPLIALPISLILLLNI